MSRDKDRPTLSYAASDGSYRFFVVGHAPPGLRDFYHGFLRAPWWVAFASIIAGYLALNLVFALGYLTVGGVANAQPGSLVDAFFFSVQTMGTIGYGAMYPTSRAANVLVVAESVSGLIVTALATGLVFVRFSLTKARVVFSERAVISPVDGTPTLMLRVGNERSNFIVAARFELTISRRVHSGEGVLLYRSEPLRLVRDRAQALTRSWNVMHRIDEASPLFGATPESLVADEVELIMSLAGTDDTSLQPVHMQHRYLTSSLVFGARLADVLSETPEGDMLLDLRHFHTVVPTEPTAAFPYPREQAQEQTSGA